MHDLQEAVRLHRLGHSLRRIAELLQTGRVTLRKYLGPIAAAGLLDGSPDELPTASALRQALVGLEARPAPTHERSSLEPWRDLIVAKRAAGASPKSVHDYLRRTDPDYVASVSAMKRFFVRLALVEGPNEKDVAIPVVTVAGEIAQVCDLEPGDFVWTGGDTHLYVNHLEQVDLQLSRSFRSLPGMKINPAVRDIFAFQFEDFELLNYDPWPGIKAPVAV